MMLFHDAEEGEEEKELDKDELPGASLAPSSSSD